MAERMTGEMPFLDHLEELRWRLVRSFAALGIGMAVGFFVVYHFHLIAVLARPIAPYLHGHKLVYTHPADTFSTELSVAFVFGAILALPVIGYQVWAFLSPALYKHEKRIVLPVLGAAVLLFACGVALAYFFVMPISLQFLLGLESQAMEPMITASDYFGFMTTLALAFGGTFEMPLVVVALTAIGVVTPMFLTKYRRHAIVLCWLVAAVVTPGDFLGTTLALAIPLYLLFELSVVLSKIVYRRKERRHAELIGEEAAT
ncbi:MAG TPA: twin-arginine translocase subunit TatC [Gemmatimonadaceae bacterium]|jgi:sec-independent protein translocase protein TatC|nr:twin-arginine translocase subunit TatC [Gemmatimonadaceae bacterium]